MKHIVMLMLVLLSMPTATWAATVKMRCHVSHFVRFDRAEMHSTSIRFNNGDPVNAATIERLTIYDFFGIVVWDSGPKTSVLHPLNTDFLPPVGPVDISTVPPNANYYIRTNHIWGNDSIPPLPPPDDIGGNQRGQLMSVVVEFSKQGNHHLFVVSTSPRARGRISGLNEQAETSSSSGRCFRVRRRDNDDDEEDDDEKDEHKHRGKDKDDD